MDINLAAMKLCIDVLILLIRNLGLQIDKFKRHLEKLWYIATYVVQLQFRSKLETDL